MLGAASLLGKGYPSTAIAAASSSMLARSLHRFRVNNWLNYVLDRFIFFIDYFQCMFMFIDYDNSRFKKDDKQLKEPIGATSTSQYA
jgi:hypothetical protein